MLSTFAALVVFLAAVQVELEVPNVLSYTFPLAFFSTFLKAGFLLNLASFIVISLNIASSSSTFVPVPEPLRPFGVGTFVGAAGLFEAVDTVVAFHSIGSSGSLPDEDLSFGDTALTLVDSRI